jgi:hypothetical protein
MSPRADTSVGPRAVPPAPSATRLSRALEAALVALFLLALAAPTIDAFVRDEAARGPGPELRRAAEMPRFPATVAQLAQFPAAFEAHFNDTFGLRDRLLRLNSLEKHGVFGSTPAKSIVTGADGWLFWGGDHSPETFRGVMPFTAEELAGWQYELESRARALAKNGCRYVWITAPNKESIYPEQMPEAMRPVGPTRLDQFTRWMAEHSSVDVLDLRPVLRAEKTRDTGPYDAVYSPYGTHWTGRGVITVVNAIVEHLAQENPGAKPLSPEEILIARVPAGADSLAGNLYLKDVLTTPDFLVGPRDDQRVEVIEKRTDAPARTVSIARGTGLLPHTLLFHDSFGPFTWSLLSACCETLETHHDYFDPRVVDPGRTRIVIDMYVERLLATRVPDSLTAPEQGNAVERFQAVPHLLFDFASTPSAGVPIASMPLERVEVDGKPALRFAQRETRHALTFPGIRMPRQGEVCVWIEIDTPAAGLFDVGWRRASTSSFRRKDRATIALEAGRNSRLVWLPPLGVESVLMLRPRDHDVTVTLTGFAVRSGEAP